MTPDQLITGLHLRREQVDRIVVLKASFDQFEDILHGRYQEHLADTPLRKGLLIQAQDCVNLIAQILGEDPSTVQQALLTMFGLTVNQYNLSCTSIAQIVAFSALVAAAQH